MSSKIYSNKRREFHKGIKAGLTPLQIAQEHNISELSVVRTLRHPNPKIKGANYKHLKIPVPLDEIITHFHENKLDGLSERYGVSKTTLYQRLPQELRVRNKRGRRPKPKESEILTQDEKTDIINRYYRSGRKLNACGVPINVAKDVLVDLNVPVRSHDYSVSIHKRYQVALLDYLICACKKDEISIDELHDISRILYELKTNEPPAWKGQLLDWFLNERLKKNVMICINNAIDYIHNLKGYEDESI